jgi:hypothetical protein
VREAREKAQRKEQRKRREATKHSKSGGVEKQLRNDAAYVAAAVARTIGPTDVVDYGRRGAFSKRFRTFLRVFSVFKRSEPLKPLTDARLVGRLAGRQDAWSLGVIRADVRGV